MYLSTRQSNQNLRGRTAVDSRIPEYLWLEADTASSIEPFHKKPSKIAYNSILILMPRFICSQRLQSFAIQLIHKMGSVPNTGLRQMETLPVIDHALTPDSSEFLDRIKRIKCHSSVADLKKAADETRAEVSKALNSINNNPFIFNNRKPRLQSRSIHMIEFTQNKKKRAITEIEERKEIHCSVVVKPKEPVKCPQIKIGRNEQIRKGGLLIKREKTSSGLGILYPYKK